MALAFGTSGIRGLVSEFTEIECFKYVSAFIRFLSGAHARPSKMILAGDLRQSSPKIKAMITVALANEGIEILDAGTVPTPVLALACNDLGLPGIMVTGSHIPADRNGFKFYIAEGEILKCDEKAISEYYSELKDQPLLRQLPQVRLIDACTPYVSRYLSVFGAASLSGLNVGFYEHSSVGRDLFINILKELGANVLAFGREDNFVPVDTEAVSSVDSLRKVLRMHQLDAIVSTDGDADRPLVLADDGQLVPGEILGLITSRELSIHTVVCPISCSTLIEKSGWVGECVRTQIGSPFVLGKIKELKDRYPNRSIAGFEANGGYLLATNVGGLKPLNTRDSLLPILAVLAAAKRDGQGKISRLLSTLPRRVNLSGLIKDFSRDKALETLSEVADVLNSTRIFHGCEVLGKVVGVDSLDGLRLTFDSGTIVHLRPSGNAPEFRIYIEAASILEAEEAMRLIRKWIKP